MQNFSYKFLIVFLAITSTRPAIIENIRSEFVVEPLSSIKLTLVNPMDEEKNFVSISLIAKKGSTLKLVSGELSEETIIHNTYLYKELNSDQIKKDHFELEVVNPSDAQQIFYGFSSFVNELLLEKNTDFGFTFVKNKYGTVVNYDSFYLNEDHNNNLEFYFLYSTNIETIEPTPDFYEILSSDENFINFQGFPLQGDDYLDRRFYLNYFIIAEDNLTGQLWKFENFKPFASCQLIEMTSVLEQPFNESTDEIYCFKHEELGESYLTTWTDSDNISIEFDVYFEVDGVLSYEATNYGLSKVISNTKTFKINLPSQGKVVYSVISLKATSTQLEAFNFYYLSMISNQNQIIELKSGEEFRIYASSFSKSILLKPADNLKSFATFQAYSESNIIESFELFSEKNGEKPISLAKAKNSSSGAKVIKYNLDLTNKANYYAVLKISESLKSNENTLIRATLSIGEIIDNLTVAWYDFETPLRMQYNILPFEDDIALILNENYDIATVKAYASEKSSNLMASDLSGYKLSVKNGAVRFSRDSFPNANTIIIEGSLIKSKSNMILSLVSVAPVEYNDVGRIQNIISTKSDPAIFKLDLSKDSMANFFIYSPDTSKTITVCIGYENPIVQIKDENLSDIKIKLTGGSASKIDIPTHIRLIRNPVYMTVFIEDSISANIELIKSFKDYHFSNSLDTPLGILLSKGQSKYIRFRIPDGVNKLYFFPIFDKGNAAIYYVLDSTSEMDLENHSFKPNFTNSKKIDETYESVEIKNNFLKFLNFKIIALEDTTGRFIITDGNSETAITNKKPKAVFMSSNLILNYKQNDENTSKEMYLIVQTLSARIKFAFDSEAIEILEKSTKYIDREIDTSNPIKLEIEDGKSTIVLLEFFERDSFNNLTRFKVNSSDSKYELNNNSSVLVFSIPAVTTYKLHDISLKLDTGVAFKSISHILIKSERYTTNEEDVNLRNILFYKIGSSNIAEKRMGYYNVSVPSKEESFFLIIFFEVETSQSTSCSISNKVYSIGSNKTLTKTPAKYSVNESLRSLIKITDNDQLGLESQGLVSVYTRNYENNRCVAEIDNWYYSLKNSANHLFINSLPDYNVMTVYCPNIDDYIYSSSVIPVDQKFNSINISVPKTEAHTIVNVNMKPTNSTAEITIKPETQFMKDFPNNTVTYFNMLDFSNTKNETVNEIDYFENPEKFYAIGNSELKINKQIDSNSYYTAIIAKDSELNIVQLYQSTHFNLKNTSMTNATDSIEKSAKAPINSTLLYAVAGFGAIMILGIIIWLMCCICTKKKNDILVENEDA